MYKRHVPAEIGSVYLIRKGIRMLTVSPEKLMLAIRLKGISKRIWVKIYDFFYFFIFYFSILFIYLFYFIFIFFFFLHLIDIFLFFFFFFFLP